MTRNCPWLPLLLVICCVGCAATPYRYGTQCPPTPRLIDDGEMIERGKPRPVLDTVGWYFGIPGKLILWDRRVDNHNIGAETESVMVGYLVDNQMPDVKVRINQYAPGKEWHRLWKNDHVGLGWRATFGVVSWLGYTIFPGRLFGGDAYNPYTHSIYLYSDIPAVALHEGGHAKDFASRSWPGTYAAVGLLPTASLYVEAVATKDVFAYLKEQQRDAELAAAYRILYPAYGTYVGGELADLFWPGYSALGSIAGAIPGHIIGRYRAKQLE